MRATMGIVREDRHVRLGLYTESCLGFLSAAEHFATQYERPTVLNDQNDPITRLFTLRISALRTHSMNPSEVFRPN